MNKNDAILEAAALRVIDAAEASLQKSFASIEQIELINQKRVLGAFQREQVAQRHFAPSNGYGYDDIGRDTLDRVFAHALQTEDALVRPQIANGTQAIFTALSGLLQGGDTMLAITGKPYDTLESAIGLRGNCPGSLKSMGVKYKETQLLNGVIDLPSVLREADESVRVVYVQRSRGYAWRNAIHPRDMKDAFTRIHDALPDAYIVVDNCYGEFVCEYEPSAVGSDVIIGSLIKNPGGGIAPTGGYIAGRKECIAKIENRLTVPGMGREVGSYAGGYSPFYQGLFLSPHIVAQALKTAALFAAVFEKAGMTTMPESAALRSDIVQALRFKDAESLCAFCQSIQASSPVDSFLTPEPWDMPGYEHQVIMAAGAFVQGSSIELSADGPLCPPYTAYIQGGLSYVHGKIAVQQALITLHQKGVMNILDISR